MNIIRFKGGLGNQMFQYAFGKAMELHGLEVAYDTSFYSRNKHLRQFELTEVFKKINLTIIPEIEYLKLENEWEIVKKNKNSYINNIIDANKRLFYIEYGHSQFYEEVYSFTNCVYVGYWQTEKYFSSIKKTINCDFEFTVKEMKLKENAQCILDNNLYGVHIRRGDFLGTQHEVCDENYYIRALKIVKSLDANANFIFFSDDYEWIKKQKFVSEKDIIQSSSEYIDYKDWYDMYLMSQCKGNVISNSSFSWWGAWLGSGTKMVIAPRKWYKNDKAPYIHCDNWMLI